MKEICSLSKIALVAKLQKKITHKPHPYSGVIIVNFFPLAHRLPLFT